MLARLLLPVSMVALVLSGCGDDPSSAPTADASPAPTPNEITLTEAELDEVPLETVTVTERAVETTLELPGRVHPEADQEAFATSLISGRVERLRVGIGATVQRGQVLADIAAPDLSGMVADLRQAHDDLARQRRLEERGVAITKTLRAAERAWTAARQRLRSMGVSEARIERVATGDEDLTTLPLEAPMSGVVVDRMTVLGAPVDEGESLFRIVDLQPIRIVADVFERVLGQIREGQRVAVTTAMTPGRVDSSTIAQVVPQVDAETRAATARIRLPNTDGHYQPGMYATVRVTVAGPVQPAVPSAALRSDAEGTFVLLQTDARTFQRRYVDAPADVEGVVAVPELTPGTRVVTGGAFQIVSAMDQR